MLYRKLTKEDSNAFYDLRLKGLQENPSAFSESAAEFEQLGRSGLSERMEASRKAGGFIIGAFDGAKLCGVIGFFPESKEKTKHYGSVWGTYVLPESRGAGLGKALLEKLLGLLQIKLSVESENTTAIRLYEKLGFVAYGEEPHALKIDGAYYNETHMMLPLRQA